MKAERLLDERVILGEDVFIDIRVWRVPKPVRGSTHAFKYALAFIVNGVCALRYDNEAGKGDHYHVGEVEHDYVFTTVAELLADFRRHVAEWRPR